MSTDSILGVPYSPSVARHPSCHQLLAEFAGIPARISGLFKERFVSVEQIPVPHFYAGWAVLGAFYDNEVWAAEPPCLVVACGRYVYFGDESELRAELAARIRLARKFELRSVENRVDLWECPFEAVRVTSQKCAFRVLPIYMQDPDTVTSEQLYEEFLRITNIKASALAWDGNRLYYPPQVQADLVERRCRLRTFVGPVAAAHARVFLTRGFRLDDEATGMELTLF